MDTLITFFRETTAVMAPWAVTSTALALLVVFAVLADLIAKRQLIRLATRITRNTKHTWDDALVSYNVFGRLSQLIPCFAFYYGFRFVPGLPTRVVSLTQDLVVS